MRIKDLPKLAVSIFICLATGSAGSVYTRGSIEQWYRYLVKPSFNPPAWVFAPVWTILYFMMGLSLYLVWTAPLSDPFRKKGMILFFIQLILNGAWSPVFFGLRSISGGLVIIVLMWFFILATFYYFRKVSFKAALLLVPYLIWVSYAFLLNLSLLLLNT